MTKARAVQVPGELPTASTDAQDEENAADLLMSEAEVAAAELQARVKELEAENAALKKAKGKTPAEPAAPSNRAELTDKGWIVPHSFNAERKG